MSHASANSVDARDRTAPPPAAEDEEESDTLCGLFISEDYVEKTWRFNDLEQPLLCSNMSSVRSTRSCLRSLPV